MLCTHMHCHPWCVVVQSFSSTITAADVLTDGDQDSDCVTLFSRMVCQALVSSDSLEWERTQLWALTFKLIRKIIGGVDYKVRNKLMP